MTTIPQAADLDLLATETEDDLRATVRDLLANRCEPTAVAAIYDGDRSLVAPLWQALAVDLGLAGLLVPEELGGAGASAPRSRRRPGGAGPGLWAGAVPDQRGRRHDGVAGDRDGRRPVRARRGRLGGPHRCPHRAPLDRTRRRAARGRAGATGA